MESISIDAEPGMATIDDKVVINKENHIGNLESSDPQQAGGDGLSKKGRKRLLMQEMRKDAKKIRKLKDKENKKSSKPRSFRLPSTASASAADGSSTETVNVSRKERKESGKIEFAGLCIKNFTVIIDLNWEEHHTEKALKSLKQQVMYCYGFNKRHLHPASIHLTGVGPLLSTQLVAQNHADNWIGMKISREEYITLDQYSVAYDDDVKAGLKKQLVYLSSDAEETIDTLDTNCAYIIGGIVDRNRLKGITYKKALAQGLRTAKLPIKENYAIAATHILTVNHVFEILLNYEASGGWRKAMEAVLPQRKHAKALTGVKQQGKDGDNCDDENDDDDEEEHEGVEENEEATINVGTANGASDEIVLLESDSQAQTESIATHSVPTYDAEVIPNDISLLPTDN